MAAAASEIPVTLVTSPLAPVPEPVSSPLSIAPSALQRIVFTLIRWTHPAAYPPARCVSATCLPPSASAPAYLFPPTVGDLWSVGWGLRSIPAGALDREAALARGVPGEEFDALVNLEWQFRQHRRHDYTGRETKDSVDQTTLFVLVSARLGRGVAPETLERIEPFYGCPDIGWPAPWQAWKASCQVLWVSRLETRQKLGISSDRGQCDPEAIRKMQRDWAAKMVGGGGAASSG
jgi:hypothetical protein